MELKETSALSNTGISLCQKEGSWRGGVLLTGYNIVEKGKLAEARGEGSVVRLSVLEIIYWWLVWRVSTVLDIY